MNIQVAELASRYGMSEKDFQNVLKEHLEALNDDGEHVKFVAKKWLFDELNQSKQEYDSLQDRLSNVQFEKDHADKRISLMLLQIKQAINIVQSAQSQLTALLAESDSKVKQEPQSQAKEKSAETFVKPISTEELHQTIEAQKETQKKKKESAFHRVAGFFGFL